MLLEHCSQQIIRFYCCITNCLKIYQLKVTLIMSQFLCFKNPEASQVCGSDPRALMQLQSSCLLDLGDNLLTHRVFGRTQFLAGCRSGTSVPHSMGLSNLSSCFLQSKGCEREREQVKAPKMETIIFSFSSAFLFFSYSVRCLFNLLIN